MSTSCSESMCRPTKLWKVAGCNQSVLVFVYMSQWSLQIPVRGSEIPEWSPEIPIRGRRSPQALPRVVHMPKVKRRSIHTKSEGRFEGLTNRCMFCWHLNNRCMFCRKKRNIETSRSEKSEFDDLTQAQNLKSTPFPTWNSSQVEEFSELLSKRPP